MRQDEVVRESEFLVYFLKFYNLKYIDKIESNNNENNIFI